MLPPNICKFIDGGYDFTIGIIYSGPSEGLYVAFLGGTTPITEIEGIGETVERAIMELEKQLDRASIPL